MGSNGSTVVEKVREAYARIAECDRPEVWISLRAESDVLTQAADVDARVARGDELPLAGVLVGVKDNIDVGGLDTTCACPAFARGAAADATVVARLTALGAVVLGKTNLDQFATGLVGTRSPYGAVRHSTMPDRVSGGSSSGSAVAVALGMVDVALGTDTAGSGRVPAALNGIVGIKPTLGLVSTAGVVPACPDFDAVTVFARDIGLAGRVVAAMIGGDPGDPRSRTWPADTPQSAPASPTVAVPAEADLAALSPGYRQAFDATVAAYSAAGATVVTLDMADLLDAATLLYDSALVAERYAAVGEFVETHPDDVDPVVGAIVRASADQPAHRYVDDRTALAVTAATWRARFADVDALLLPTTTEHPTIAEVAAEPVAINRRMGTFTNFCNLLDLAAVAVPGEPTPQGEPFGVMLVGPAFADQVVLDLAARLTGEPSPVVTGDSGVELVVVGAHMRSLPLHHQLVAAHARFLGEVETSAAYRMVALDSVPPKPGLVRVGGGDGASLPGELYRMSPAALGSFLHNLPAPMSLGKVELADGRWVTGFVFDRESVSGATDVTEHGGWRAYMNPEVERSTR
ncbi:allophanate hydrolase [Gordonia araii NBRC 100433]|nr:allophanate hydrolase [Gordonia araii NBRC 100433]